MEEQAVEIGNLRTNFEQFIIYANELALDLGELDLNASKSTATKIKTRLLDLRRKLKEFDDSFDVVRERHGLYK